MLRLKVSSLILVLVSALTVGAAELPASAQKLARYHVVTVPATNKKRVDAMCIRYLSVIPKAKLIPKASETTVYRLIATTHDTLPAAKKRRNDLLPYGESPFVMTTSYGYSVVVGSQLTEALAEAERQRLAAKNIVTTIHELRVALKEWQMRSEESFSLRDAVHIAAKLSELGVVTTLEPEQ